MISINYSPSSIEDFERACQIVSNLNLNFSPNVATPRRSTENDAVMKYCAARSIKRYYRSPEGVECGLSAIEDLKLRAKAGDSEAIKALEPEIENEISDIEVSSDLIEAPEDGQTY